MTKHSQNGQMIPGDDGYLSYPSKGENERFGAHSSNTHQGVDADHGDPLNPVTKSPAQAREKDSAHMDVSMPRTNTVATSNMTYQQKAAAALGRSNSAAPAQPETAKQKTYSEAKAVQEKALNEIAAARNNIAMENPEAYVQEIARKAGLNYDALDSIGGGRKTS